MEAESECFSSLVGEFGFACDSLCISDPRGGLAACVLSPLLHDVALAHAHTQSDTHTSAGREESVHTLERRHRKREADDEDEVFADDFKDLISSPLVAGWR